MQLFLFANRRVEEKYGFLWKCWLERMNYLKRSSPLISNTIVLIIASILIIRNIYLDISFYTTSYSLAVCALIISSS